MPDVIKNLPVSVQVLFWGSALLIGLLWALNLFWAKRSLDAHDKKMTKFDEQLAKALNNASTAMASLKDVSVIAKTELLDFRKEMAATNEEFRREYHLIKNDLSQITLRVHVVRNSLDTLDTAAKTIVENLKEDRAHVNGLENKVLNLEEDQKKIVTVLHQISDRLIKVSQRKN
jgi:chromosome segregation ATPase